MGLNNDARWKDFREIELADQQVFHRLLASMNADAEFPAGIGEGAGSGTPRRFDTGTTVADEIVSHFVPHSFLDPKGDRVLEAIRNQPIPGTPLKMRDLTAPQTLRQKLLHHGSGILRQPLLEGYALQHACDHLDSVGDRLVQKPRVALKQGKKEG